jgi:ribosomal protein S18 acetylase RimI-like enzyme
LKILGHNDPDASKFLKSIPRYVDTLAKDDIPFFIIVDDAWVRAIVSIHTEPYFFYAAGGSKLGRIVILNPDLMNIDQVLDSAGRIVQSEGLAYLVYTNSHIPDELREKLEKHEYGQLDHSYSMYVDLDEPPESPEGLVFKPQAITDQKTFLDLQIEFFKGTEDPATHIIQQNLPTLTDEELGSMFNEDTSYLALQGEEVVGLVVISIDRGLLMSIAVPQRYRGKGISKKLMAFALIRLKELGWGKVYLRVHVDNSPAIKLYESFGFAVESEMISFVYFPTCQLLEQSSD